MAGVRYEILGRHMNGTEVVKYELYDHKTGTNVAVTREQCAFLIGKGVIEGVQARLYRDTLIIEAAPGYKNISELPVRNVNTGQFKNVPSGNRRIEVSFDTGAIVARTNKNNFVVKTGTGTKIISKRELEYAIANDKIINANIQTYTDKNTGRVSRIVRLSDKSKMADLPMVTE